jgi:hypothetical protein
MKINIKAIALIFMAAAINLSSCTKTKYSFGDIKTPTDVSLTAKVAGVTDATPNGTGNGAVTITLAAQNAITYKVDFGDGHVLMEPAGTINYNYTSPGTFDYTITVSAVGTGGTSSTTSKKVTVFVAFTIPEAIVTALTGNASKVWQTANETVGHVGVGPADTYQSDYYSAGPNERAACLYDDEITFTKVGNGITMSIDNKGASFFTAASTAFYGKSGGDNCYDIDETGVKKLAFMNATSGSTTANSTRIQFVVPGNGLINFGTGGTAYEIMAYTDNTITLRNIGIDKLAWYQKLQVKK